MLFLYLILGVLLLTAAFLMNRDLPRETIIERHRSPESRFIKLPNGAHVHYQDQGNPDGPTIILIHGFMASLFDFDKWQPFLGKEFRVVRLDMPGMGLTGSYPEIDHSLSGRAKFLKEFLDAIHVEHVHVVGHSLGGATAWIFALMYPQSTASLTLIAAAGFNQSAEPRLKPLGFRLAETPVIRFIVRCTGSRSLVRQALSQLVDNQNVIHEQWIDRAFEMSRMADNRASILALRPFKPPYDALAKLGSIAVPTLIMWGQNDYLIPVRHAHLFKNEIKNAELVTYPGVGHYPQIEQPEDSARTLSHFFANTPES
ncbi:MAG: alpha/beta fold hydrolase [Alcanivorax sp.]|uniref:alpha/beta fold hydrolase n=1 Tax=Alcanivorax sp. TaxID=1872427 RepID=UPI003DA786F1